MHIGEKLRSARLEAGLSQRALCGDTITRNMLSQIEHGTARPSMDTLRILAARLERPVSWFLEEESVVSPNQAAMAEARRCFDRGEMANALTMLEHYRAPDPVYDREKDLLEVLALLDLAAEAVAEERKGYARALLERIHIPEGMYLAGELARRRLCLLARLDRENLKKLSQLLPSPDGELQLRAEGALAQGDADRAGRLLEAMQSRQGGQWNLLRGRAYLEGKDYGAAIFCLQQAEGEYPEETAPLLELCFRETGDFRQAYLYACRQKKQS